MKIEHDKNGQADQQEDSHDVSCWNAASPITSAGVPNPALDYGSFVTTVPDGGLSLSYCSWSQRGYTLSYFAE